MQVTLKQFSTVKYSAVCPAQLNGTIQLQRQKYQGTTANWNCFDSEYISPWDAKTLSYSPLATLKNVRLTHTNGLSHWRRKSFKRAVVIWYSLKWILVWKGATKGFTFTFRELNGPAFELIKVLAKCSNSMAIKGITSTPRIDATLHFNALVWPDNICVTFSTLNIQCKKCIYR